MKSLIHPYIIRLYEVKIISFLYSIMSLLDFQGDGIEKFDLLGDRICS